MRRRRITTVLGIAAVGTAALAMIGWIGGYRVNLTSSAAIGLWRIEAMERPVSIGDVVFICLPAAGVFKDAFDRGYLRRGLCPGGLAPLLKTIVAVPGQRVRIGEDVIIDGRPLAASRIRHKDGQGRAITAFGGGTVPPGYLFLHSSMANSYDSRYFGPIPAAGLLGRASPIITTFYP
ncbi:conjugative transfer signal peptidase TraF [Aminobacter anthyllidis]|uniref:Conjugative transfer signal peptidase TraF n=1 Tax=Aminobacter anthyllidis TaxID=1035067 RepID=A0A9X1AGU7_9HYPH|nr:conjugative transfer signal peptidase TraF [Aminobacter anthyllidis]MBT1159386.1 conjugative transfer signal peptidase TraF [Aminobacter anthyllidis]